VVLPFDYLLTFNFPHQVEHTIQTWLKHDKWLTRTRNILIDNSTNDEARIANKALCEKYNFEHIITNENTGINGGRFRAAQHFQESDSDYYLFLEDDMGIHPPEETGFCRNGFKLCVDNLYDKLLRIIDGGSNLDFLKLSFTEVYMDNNIQVAWYNIPQAVRTEFYPDYDKLPEHGLDPNCPRTSFDKIEFVDGLGYITGDIYYANWPTICGKTGNQKMFLDVTWAHPYEQTWMSYMSQETIKGNLKPAVLLASPIHHNRIAHYKPEERREN
jgi:glycosyltransferase involved in cell wall biosynthesis